MTADPLTLVQAAAIVRDAVRDKSYQQLPQATPHLRGRSIRRH